MKQNVNFLAAEMRCKMSPIPRSYSKLERIDRKIKQNKTKQN